jgi:transposase
MLMGMLRYKAERAGGRFVAVDARNTSQECSGCGALVRKDLGARVHQCTQCDLELHRDVNAALVVLGRAVGVRGAALGSKCQTVSLEAVAPETSRR